MRCFSVLLNNIPIITRKQIDLGFIEQTVSKLIACIRAAFFLSQGVRRDVIFYILVEDGNHMIKLVGDKLKYLGPDTRSIAMLLMKAQTGLKQQNIKEAMFRRGVYISENYVGALETLRKITVEHVVFPNTKGKKIEKITFRNSLNCIIPIEYPFPDFRIYQLVREGYEEVFFRDIYPIDSFIVMINNKLDVLRGNDNNGDN